MKKPEYPHNKEDDDAEYLDMILHNFNYAIQNNLDLVYIGFQYVDDEYMKEYWVQKKDWGKTLDILIENSARLEEYEFAIEFKKIKSTL